jgi:hypothetical protein
VVTGAALKQVPRADSTYARMPPQTMAESARLKTPPCSTGNMVTRMRVRSPYVLLQACYEDPPTPWWPRNAPGRGYNGSRSHFLGGRR